MIFQMEAELKEFLSRCKQKDKNEILFMKDTLVFTNPNAMQICSKASREFWECPMRHREFFVFMLNNKHELKQGGNNWNCGTEPGSRWCDTNAYNREWARLWFYSIKYEKDFFDRIETNEGSELLKDKKYIIMIDPCCSHLGWERERKKSIAEEKTLEPLVEVKEG